MVHHSLSLFALFHRKRVSLKPENPPKMLKRILYLFLPTLLIACHDCGYEMDNQLVRDFNNYEEGQVIYFESNKGDLDTIKISGIDSYEICHSFTVQNYKIIDLRIEHLPKNKWKSNRPKWDEKKRKAVHGNQSLINVDMRFSSAQPTYTKWIEFRDFSGELEVHHSGKEVVDTISGELNQTEISHVYWSNHKGLIGYQKSDGQLYRLINTQ